MSDQPEDPELGFLFPETEEELMHFDIHQNSKDDLPGAEVDAIAARVLARLGAAPGVAVNLACTYCKGGLARGGSVYCAGCLAPHHPDCFHEYKGCSSCGEARFVLPKNLGSPRLSPSRSRSRPWAFIGGLAIGGLTVALGFTRWSSLFDAAPAPTVVIPLELAEPQEKTPQERPQEEAHEHAPREPKREDTPKPPPQISGFEELLAAARDHAAARRFSESMRAYHKLIELDSQRADLFIERAEVAVRLKQYDRALADLRAALRLSPSRPEAHLLGARISLAREELDAALRFVDRGIELDARRPELYAQRAAIYQALSRHVESAADLSRAVDLRPTNPQYCRQLARSLLLLKRPKEAQAYLDRALALDPRDVETYYLRAEAQASLGRPQAAALDLQRAYELDPNQARYLDALAIIQRLLAAQEKAAEAEKEPEKPAGKDG